MIKLRKSYAFLLAFLIPLIAWIFIFHAPHSPSINENDPFDMAVLHFVYFEIYLCFLYWAVRLLTFSLKTDEKGMIIRRFGKDHRFLMDEIGGYTVRQSLKRQINGYSPYFVMEDKNGKFIFYFIGGTTDDAYFISWVKSNFKEIELKSWQVNLPPWPIRRSPETWFWILIMTLIVFVEPIIFLILKIRMI